MLLVKGFSRLGAERCLFFRKVNLPREAIRCFSWHRPILLPDSSTTFASMNKSGRVFFCELKNISIKIYRLLYQNFRHFLCWFFTRENTMWKRKVDNWCFDKLVSAISLERLCLRIFKSGSSVSFHEIFSHRSWQFSLSDFRKKQIDIDQLGLIPVHLFLEKIFFVLSSLPLFLKNELIE